MSILAKGNINLSFKDQNPIICTKLEFAELYDDHSKKIADKLMWGICFLEEPDFKDNPYSRMLRKEREVEIKKSWCNQFDVVVIKDAIRAYGRWCLDFDVNLLRIQTRKLDELTAYWDQLSLDNDKDFKKYMDISDKLSKIWKNFDEIKARVEDSEKKSTTFGGVQLSKSEERRK